MPGFESIIDQDRPVRILTTFLYNGTIPHALLFTGIDGVGKESTAVLFAMACNCAKGSDGTRSAVPPANATRREYRSYLKNRILIQGRGGTEYQTGGIHPYFEDLRRGTNPAEKGGRPKDIFEIASNIPCGTCKPCRKIEAGNHPDIIRIKPSGPVIKINQIRTLNQILAMKPYEARMRVVIISDAQAMNPAAGNALLKMLEEPPARTILILVANQTADLLPTIVSRCQHLRFKPISKKYMESLLIRKHGLDPGDAQIIATMAGGSLSRALRMDRTQWIKRRNWLIGEMESLTTGSVNHLLAFGEQLSKNKDILPDSLEVMNSWLRDLIVGKLNPDKIINQDLTQKIQQTAPDKSNDSLLKQIETIQSTQNAIRSGTNLRLALEAMVLKLANV